MAPPMMGPPANEEANAKESLDRAKKLIEDLEKKGFSVSEAKSWYDQADEMFRGGLYRTSLIYSGYALDAAGEVLERMKSMLVRISKVKTRANEMLGKDHRDMPKLDQLIGEMKKAVNDGDLDEAQELVNAADTLMRGGSSPYLAVETVGVATVSPSRGYTSCPSCGNIVETTWIKCRYCEAELGEEEEAASTGPAWASGVTGPLLISDKVPRGMPGIEKPPVVEEPPAPPKPEPEPVETEVDKGLSEDMKELEKVEEDMERMQKVMEEEATEAEAPTEEREEGGKEPEAEVKGEAEVTKAEEAPVTKPAIRIPPPPSFDDFTTKKEEVAKPEGAEEGEVGEEKADEKAGEGPAEEEVEGAAGEVEEPAEEEEAPTEATGECPKCGEELEPDFVKCPICKTPLK